MPRIKPKCYSMCLLKTHSAKATPTLNNQTDYHRDIVRKTTLIRSKLPGIARRTTLNKKTVVCLDRERTPTLKYHNIDMRSHNMPVKSTSIKVEPNRTRKLA